VAFKIPNAEVEKRDADDFVAHWEPDKKTFTLQLYFKKNAFVGGKEKARARSRQRGGSRGVRGAAAAGRVARRGSRRAEPPPPPPPPRFA